MISPVYLVLSVPPNVNSPLVTTSVVVGSNETETSLAVRKPFEKELSVTVGIDWFDAGDKVPTVRSTGPRLEMRLDLTAELCVQPLETNPKTPSTPVKPLDVLASPIDCWVMTRLVEIVTVSLYSVPLKDLDP